MTTSTGNGTREHSRTGSITERWGLELIVALLGILVGLAAVALFVS